jgi:PAS domain S-box-containing protein
LEVPKGRSQRLGRMHFVSEQKPTRLWSAPGLLAVRDRSEASTQPVLRRLLIPLTTVLTLVVGGFTTVLYKAQHESLNQASQTMLKDVANEMSGLLAEQSRALAGMASVLLRGKGLRDSLKDLNRGRLLAAHEGVFSELRAEQGVTHMYFHGPDRVNLLRVHAPERHGDIIDRFTLREAERTGKVASGIELGPLGTFTLRAVRPVFKNDTLIGYLELGKEIEDVLVGIHDQHDIEIAVSIRKARLNRPRWEAGMAMLDREAEWDRLPNDVLIYSSLPVFPAKWDGFVAEHGHTDDAVIARTEFGNRSWHVLVLPLSDASQTEVGDVLVFHDMSESEARFRGRLVGLFVVTLGVLGGMLGFVFFLLRRVDRGVLAQQAELTDREERFRTLFEANRDALMMLDDNRFFACNQAALTMFECATHEEFCSKNPGNVSPIKQPDGCDSLTAANEKTAMAMKEGHQRFDWVHKRCGTGEEFPAEVLISAMQLGDRTVLQATVRDITERKRAEAELAKSLAETERMNRLLTGREMRVVEMKREVNELLEELERAPVYGSVES